MKPDTSFDPIGFAESWWEHQRKLSAFEDHLLCSGGDGFDFASTGTDSYDFSVEIYGAVPPGMLLNEAQQRLIFDAGFRTVFVNYSEGIGAYYHWRGEFEVIGTPGQCASRVGC